MIDFMISDISSSLSTVLMCNKLEKLQKSDKIFEKQTNDLEPIKIRDLEECCHIVNFSI